MRSGALTRCASLAAVIRQHRWFCNWRRKAPGSQTTGTAECDADPGEEVDFAVRRRH